MVEVEVCALLKILDFEERLSIVESHLVEVRDEVV